MGLRCLDQDVVVHAVEISVNLIDKNLRLIAWSFIDLHKSS